VSDHTIVWFPDAVDELRRLSVRQMTSVLNNVGLLQIDPRPAAATVTSEPDGLFALRADDVIIHYDVLGMVIRILMLALTR
jgi:hypothetical protein